MVRVASARAAALALLAALVPTVRAAPPDKDVVVVNGAANPIPVKTQGTVAVTGGVSVVNTPSVQLAPGTAVGATQNGAWAVSILRTAAPAMGTLTLGTPGSPGAVGPSPIFTASFGLKNSAAIATGGGAGAGKATFDELVVTRPIDASSPSLFHAAAEGRHYLSASVVLTDSSGATVATFELAEVAVSTLQETTGGADRPVETVGLSFARITETIGTSSACWDIVANSRF
jgi:hypothetical protein